MNSTYAIATAIAGLAFFLIGFYFFGKAIFLRRYAVDVIYQADRLRHAAQVHEGAAQGLLHQTQQLVLTGELSVKPFHLTFPPMNKFDNQDTREGFAIWLSVLLNIDKQFEFRPYMKVPGDSLEWVLDQNNDWWLHFDRNDPHVVRIKHRYGYAPLERAVAILVAHRYNIGAVIVEE